MPRYMPPRHRLTDFTSQQCQRWAASWQTIERERNVPAQELNNATPGGRTLLHEAERSNVGPSWVRNTNNIRGACRLRRSALPIQNGVTRMRGVSDMFRSAGRNNNSTYSTRRQQDRTASVVAIFYFILFRSFSCLVVVKRIYLHYTTPLLT
jgi:hypothetical protein